MYTRGQFAIIGKVSVKALRYYDEINLLKPFYIDENNQYKYYSNEQIKDIIFINELKGFGLTLEEIKNVTEKDKDFLKTQLCERVNKLKQELQQNQRIQMLIQDKISKLEKEPIDMNNIENKYVIEEVTLEKIIAVSCRDKVDIKDIGRIIGKVYENIAAHKLKPVDSHMLIYHDNEFDPDNADIEVCVPVDKEFSEDGFSTKVIVQGNYIMTKHRCGFSSIGKAHASIIDYVKENGLALEGCPFEKYVSGNNSFLNPLDIEVQVYYPVR
jgi:DNA-binding transcriptional MerR regulator